MAIKEAKTNTDLDALFTQLAEPFDPNQIKWRVTHTTQDGSRGAVVAYADPRAYTDRLNQLFTPTGWTRTYEVSTVSAVTRMKKDKLIQTGKVLVTCTLTISGLGCHAGSGEDWADESNAMTTAEAQAFKRAASCYGLGRYLFRSVGVSHLVGDDVYRKTDRVADHMQVVAEPGKETYFGSRPCQQLSIGRQRIQRAEEAQAVNEFTNEGIDWDHTFGFEFTERDMNSPLIRTGRSQAVIRQVSAFADAHAGVAE
jgi:hypothetical protein